MHLMSSFQKVYYKVKEAGKGNEELIKESVTRSCSAGICDSRNDLGNCSHDQLENALVDSAATMLTFVMLLVHLLFRTIHLYY